MKSFDISTPCISNINTSDIGNTTITEGRPPHQLMSWPVVETTTNLGAGSTSPQASRQDMPDINSNAILPTYGLGVPSNYMQFDNLTNIPNVARVTNSCNDSQFCNFYSTMGHSKYSSSTENTRIGHGIRTSDYRFPWTTTRHDGFLSTRYTEPGFFMSSYRKPKRVRTAFSPTQLLRLEHAFEKNHYVVGQERKELSASLNLSEIQVKVWFQNRRTKHKRTRGDDDRSPCVVKGRLDQIYSGYSKNTPNSLSAKLDQNRHILVL